MQADQLFSLANALALPAWLLLVFAPRWRWSPRLAFSVAAMLLAVLYSVLIFSNFSLSDSASFNSLAGVKALFQNDYLVVAGWVHYLAFDLCTGLAMSADARRRNLPHSLLVPCLFFTFMLGPFGLLLYALLRSLYLKKWVSLWGE